MACTNCNTTNCTECAEYTIPTGPAGRGITSITSAPDGTVTVVYTDGTSAVVGTITGAAGTDGTDGATWHNDTGVPSGALGNVNDYYLNNTTGDYYRKTGATTWTQQGNLKGATGADGPPGPAGTLDVASAITSTLATPTVTFDVGWSGTTVTARSTTRKQLGSFNSHNGTLQWTGTHNGSGSRDILIQFGGALMSSSPENSWVGVVSRGGKWYPLRIYPDQVNGTNYYRIELDDEAVPGSGSHTYLLKISGLTFY